MKEERWVNEKRWLSEESSDIISSRPKVSQTKRTGGKNRDMKSQKDMRAIICLSGIIMMKLKLDSERETERDELLVEVNISQWGYNDWYELGVGLWNEELEEEEQTRKEIKRGEG